MRCLIASSGRIGHDLDHNLNELLCFSDEGRMRGVGRGRRIADQRAAHAVSGHQRVNDALS
jgi:hypothetical protein